MKIKQLRAISILSLGNILVNFDNYKGGTVLVEGINHDSPADSNGAGKSSVFEALYWGLWGMTRRGLKGDEVINRHVKGGALSMITFESKKQFYTILRTRSYGKLGTCLRLFEGVVTLKPDFSDLEDITAIELTKGVMKDTQTLFEEIVGIGQLAFSKTAFFGQGDIRPFASLTDSELKTIFEQSLNLTDLSMDCNKITGYRKGLERNIELMSTELTAAKIKLTAAAEDLVSCENHNAIFEAEKMERDSVLKNELTEVSQKKLENNRLYESVGNSLTLSMTEKTALMTKRETLAEIKNKALDKKTALMTDIARATTRHSHLTSTIKDLEQQIIQIRSKEGDECGLCGVLMDSNAMTTATNRIALRLTEAQENDTTLVSSVSALKNNLAAFNDLVIPFDVKIAEIENRLRQIEMKISADQTTKAKCSANSISLQATIDKLKKDIQENIEKTNSVITSRIAELTIQIALHETKIEELQSNMLGLSYEVEIGKKIEIALGNTGVKSLIFDHVTPELNKFANEALSTLDPEMSVELTTMKKLKSGEYRDKFEVKVETKTGAEVFAGHSGGERQKVNLAISLAFNKLMRATSDSVPDILILDEPFEGLDAGTSERVTELLNSFAVDNLFLVTHNQDVKDLCSKNIIIEKRDGISTIA